MKDIYFRLVNYEAHDSVINAVQNVLKNLIIKHMSLFKKLQRAGKAKNEDFSKGARLQQNFTIAVFYRSV